MTGAQQQRILSSPRPHGVLRRCRGLLTEYLARRAAQKERVAALARWRAGGVVQHSVPADLHSAGTHTGPNTNRLGSQTVLKHLFLVPGGGTTTSNFPHKYQLLRLEIQQGRGINRP